MASAPYDNIQIGETVELHIFVETPGAPSTTGFDFTHAVIAEGSYLAVGSSVFRVEPGGMSEFAVDANSAALYTSFPTEGGGQVNLILGDVTAPSIFPSNILEDAAGVYARVEFGSVVAFQVTSSSGGFFTFGMPELFIENIQGTESCGGNVNSTGVSANLMAVGSDLASENALELVATQIPQNQFGYFLTSQATGVPVSPLGSQGNLCLAGLIGRYNQQIFNSGSLGIGSLSLDLSNTPTSSIPVAILAGQSWSFQGWYRDQNPMATSNLTNVVTVAFQ